ncbi:MAG: Asp-tRNA(Asn)/Glu-tRNA(Gln) amidotransferase subunit GatC [Clostridia bacterium]|nr:Asp-tRNA(Asn)/Glu-tRNA(Gln) amidotransferase subunit GatC [Clostridia bacterium]
MKITERDVEKLARLAMLEFDEKEKRTLAEEMERIIAFAQTVAAAGEAREEPADELGDRNVWRADDPEIAFSRDEMLAAAPSSEDGFIAVPRALAKED